MVLVKLKSNIEAKVATINTMVESTHTSAEIAARFLIEAYSIRTRPFSFFRKKTKLSSNPIVMVALNK
jgi:hypothetical protein